MKRLPTALSKFSNANRVFKLMNRQPWSVRVDSNVGRHTNTRKGISGVLRVSALASHYPVPFRCKRPLVPAQRVCGRLQSLRG